jgi:hypothetical protein
MMSRDNWFVDVPIEELVSLISPELLLRGPRRSYSFKTPSVKGKGTLFTETS